MVLESDEAAAQSDEGRQPDLGVLPASGPVARAISARECGRDKVGMQPYPAFAKANKGTTTKVVNGWSLASTSPNTGQQPGEGRRETHGRIWVDGAAPLCNHNVMERYGYTAQPQNLDAVFAALADPTRRAILSRLAAGEASVNEIAAPFADEPAGGVEASESAGAGGVDRAGCRQTAQAGAAEG